LTPSFRWDVYLASVGLADLPSLNVTEPAFYKELNRLLQSEPIASWRGYLRWHLARSRAAYLGSAFVRADYDFYRAYLRGVPELRPRWRRCVSTRTVISARRSARRLSKGLPARSEQSAGHGEGSGRHGKRIHELPWMEGPQGQALRSCMP
jgi:hypothetical protein